MHLSAQRRRFTPLRYFGVLLFVIAAIVAGGAVWIYASASPADPGGAIVPLAMFGPIVAIVVIIGFLALLGAIFNGLGWFQGGGVDAAPRDSIHDDDWRPYRPPPR